MPGMGLFLMMMLTASGERFIGPGFVPAHPVHASGVTRGLALFLLILLTPSGDRFTKPRLVPADPVHYKWRNDYWPWTCHGHTDHVRAE